MKPEMRVGEPSRTPLVVLHLAPLDWEMFNGLPVSVPALVKTQNARGDVRAALVLTAKTPSAPPDVPFPMFDSRTLLRGDAGLGLPAPYDRPHVAVFHSTYIPVHAVIAARLRRLHIPYILCPRSGMTRFAQSYRRWKKRLGNVLFFNRLVAHAAAVQYLTRGEAAASEGWRRPMFIAGNGVDLPPLSAVRPVERTTGGLRLVFIGRFHLECKGLDLLLDAAALAHRELCQAGASIELYGPDHDGSTRFLEDRVAQLGLEGVVKIHGPVAGEAKRAVLERADLFLHPSRNEGQPNAVLEALSYGVPCLLTAATNMAEDVVAAGAGWEIEPSPAGIAAGIRRVLAADRSALQQAGANARELVVREYTWEQVASRAVEAYRVYIAASQERLEDRPAGAALLPHPPIARWHAGTPHEKSVGTGAPRAQSGGS